MGKLASEPPLLLVPFNTWLMFKDSSWSVFPRESLLYIKAMPDDKTETSQLSGIPNSNESYYYTRTRVNVIINFS